jgi:deoxyribose-phosphate aldolase
VASLFDRLTYTQIAKSIDHSLLRPELDDAFVTEGCKLLEGSDVKLGTVIGFPHGSSTTATKVFEARRALDEGAAEVDMVIDIAALRSGREHHVQEQIAAVVEVAHASGAIVKVIMENAYLDDAQKVRGCQLAEAAGADFVKTSTGFAPSGATLEDLALMRRTVSSRVQVKAAGGVRTLDALLQVLELGVTRVGATATAAMLDELRARKAAAA